MEKISAQLFFVPGHHSCEDGVTIIMLNPIFLANKRTDQTKTNRKNFRIGAKIVFVNENVFTLQSNIFAKYNFFSRETVGSFPDIECFEQNISESNFPLQKSLT